MKIKKLKTDGLIILFFVLVMIVSFSLLIFKLYQLQIVKAISSNNLSKLTKIPPLRGNIYLRDKDGNLFLAATSYYLYNLYYYPPKAKNIDKEIKTISSILSQYRDIIYPDIEKLKYSQKSVLLSKNLSDEEKKKIENLKYDSVFFEEKVHRDYPVSYTHLTLPTNREV